MMGGGVGNDGQNDGCKNRVNWWLNSALLSAHLIQPISHYIHTSYRIWLVRLSCGFVSVVNVKLGLVLFELFPLILILSQLSDNNKLSQPFTFEFETSIKDYWIRRNIDQDISQIIRSFLLVYIEDSY